MGLPDPPLSQLAQSVQRGLRSAIGTYGFAHGGLVAEYGKLPDEVLSPLGRRISVPDDWRFVILCSKGGEGLHGKREKKAFARLPPVSAERAEVLATELQQHLLPATEAGDFDGFSESLYRFGYEAGRCFEAVQGGAYNGRQLERVVQRVRTAGIRGVGQSSWGPTVFAVCRDQNQARELAQECRRDWHVEELECWISPPANGGATISRDA
jgi:predicted sugar kinase